MRLLAERDQNAQRRFAEASGLGAWIGAQLITRERELHAQVFVVDVWRSATQSERGGAELSDPSGSLVVVRDAMRALNRVSWRHRADPKKVIVFDIENQTGADSLGSVARALTDSLRVAALRQAGMGAQAVGDSTARATRDGAERRFLALQLGAGAYVAAALGRRGRDSLRVRMSVRDMSEDRSFDVPELTVPLADPFSVIPALLERLGLTAKSNQKGSESIDTDQ
ncbi:MAG: hypothetical protein ACT4P6_20110 [Gemmatimonadaceae bacterium]